MNTNDVDTRLRAAFDDLKRVVEQYESEAFREKPPFHSHVMSGRIELRLKLLHDLDQERRDVLRSMQRKGYE